MTSTLPDTIAPRPSPPTRPPPPFDAVVQLNSESLENNLIPGEYLPLPTTPRFLQSCLSQARAKTIFRYIWFAGAPGNYRALHEQRMFQREIVVCEESTLHLVWHDNQMYVKPLPPCLLNHEFWEKYIAVDEETYKLACGFLYSYCRIVRHESDFRIAMEKGLIRGDEISWETWQRWRLSCMGVFEANPDTLDLRYRYGELRLARLNMIYIFHLRLNIPAFNGYHNPHTHYGPIFSPYFAVAVVVFAFASVSLNAMQVAVATNVSPTLVTTCYRFSVAILVSVVFLISATAVGLIPVMLLDLRRGLITNKKMAKELRKRTGV
jgi:hypothetical protein